MVVAARAVGPTEAADEGVAVPAASRAPLVPQGGVSYGAFPGHDRLPVGPVRHCGGDALAVVAHPPAARRPADPEPDRVVRLVHALPSLEGLAEDDVLGANSVKNISEELRLEITLEFGLEIPQYQHDTVKPSICLCWKNSLTHCIPVPLSRINPICWWYNHHSSLVWD